MTIARARRRFRVVLDGKSGVICERYPAIGAVEERYVGLDGMYRKALSIDSKAVVHRYDLDLMRGEIFDRMIGAVVTLFHFYRGGTDR